MNASISKLSDNDPQNLLLIEPSPLYTHFIAANEEIFQNTCLSAACTVPRRQSSSNTMVAISCQDIAIFKSKIFVSMRSKYVIIGSRAPLAKGPCRIIYVVIQGNSE